MNAPHWTAGAWVGMPSVDSIDRATGEPIGQFAEGGRAEADAAIAAARHVFDRALVQMACLAEMLPIDMDALSIEQDGILGSGRSGIFEPDHGEIELLLANAMHQFDA
ncbi:hypothetical protein PQR75_10560 [Paraburkholderia fungorum]|jgi:hypothetical protein|uniref:hypothetical protein n=1 Tax=Paraburkholderia fungorum TaxID=134537 RepID=UPI0038B90E7D